MMPTVAQREDDLSASTITQQDDPPAKRAPMMVSLSTLACNSS